MLRSDRLDIALELGDRTPFSCEWKQEWWSVTLTSLIGRARFVNDQLSILVYFYSQSVQRNRGWAGNVCAV